MTRKQIYEIIEKDDGSSVWNYLLPLRMRLQGGRRCLHLLLIS